MKISINQNENQKIILNNSNIQNINVNEDEVQTIRINNTDSQNIGINQNDNQIIYVNESATIIGITDVLVNGVSVVSDGIAYVLVPTKTSELENDSGYLTEETDPTVPSYIKAISLADINKWNNKQDQLVSGSNIKTINNTSLLGSGNIDISGDESYIAGTGINIEDNIISNTITNYNDLTDLPSIPNKTSDLINDEDFVSEDDLAEVALTGSYNSLSDTPVIPDSTSDLINDSGFVTNDLLTLRLLSKQDKLKSGTNIKTINNNSLLGSGNINISGGTPTDVQINGTSIVSNNTANIITESAYNSSTNKIATKSDIPTTTSQLTNNSGFIDNTVNNLVNYPLSSSLSSVATSGSYNDLSNKPTIPTNISELNNDSGFITNSVNNLTNYMLTNDINTALGGKQDTLVSGTNIKTINSNSLLGSGDISLIVKDTINNGDFNTIGDNYPSGVYEIEGVSNSPISNTWFHVIQYNVDNQWKYQEAVAWYGTLEKYARRKVGGTWESWTKVW